MATKKKAPTRIPLEDWTREVIGLSTQYQENILWSDTHPHLDPREALAVALIARGALDEATALADSFGEGTGARLRVLARVAREDPSRLDALMDVWAATPRESLPPADGKGDPATYTSTTQRDFGLQVLRVESWYTAALLLEHALGQDPRRGAVQTVRAEVEDQLAAAHGFSQHGFGVLFELGMVDTFTRRFAENFNGQQPTFLPAGRTWHGNGPDLELCKWLIDELARHRRADTLGCLHTHIAAPSRSDVFQKAVARMLGEGRREDAIWIAGELQWLKPEEWLLAFGHPPPGEDTAFSSLGFQAQVHYGALTVDEALAGIRDRDDGIKLGNTVQALTMASRAVPGLPEAALAREGSAGLAKVAAALDAVLAQEPTRRVDQGQWTDYQVSGCLVRARLAHAERDPGRAASELGQAIERTKTVKAIGGGSQTNHQRARLYSQIALAALACEDLEMAEKAVTATSPKMRPRGTVLDVCTAVTRVDHVAGRKLLGKLMKEPRDQFCLVAALVTRLVATGELHHG